MSLGLFKVVSDYFVFVIVAQKLLKRLTLAKLYLINSYKALGNVFCF